MGMFDPIELGVPALSFKSARKGLKLQGIILPIPKLNPKTGVVDLLAFREDPDTDQAGNPRLFPSGDPILVGQMLLQTRLRNWDQTSAEFEKRTEDFPDEEDTGLRRFFVGSKYATKAVKAAYKALKVQPEVGGLFTLEVLSMETETISKGPNAGEKYTYPILQLDWKPADDAGKAVVQRYTDSDAFRMPEPPQTSGMFGGGGDDSPAPSAPVDPAPSRAASGADDEPPF